MMRTPSLAELRTARAIIRQRKTKLEATDPTHIDLKFSRQVEDYFTEQIEKLSLEQNYVINGDAIKGYTVTVNDVLRYELCPCCDKPIDTRRKAEILAHNLYRLDTLAGATTES